MSSLLTAEQLREHVETALSAEALEDLIEKNDQVILEWAGPSGWDVYEDLPVNVTETVYAGGRRFAELHQVPSEIVSVTDYYGGTPRLLGTTEYVIRGSGVERILYATFGHRTVIEYLPADRRALRKAALIDLCKLDINHDPGTQSETAGPWSQSQADYDTEYWRIKYTLWQPDPFA